MLALFGGAQISRMSPPEAVIKSRMILLYFSGYYLPLCLLVVEKGGEGQLSAKLKTVLGPG
jgi:hypothetical protein